MFGRGHISVKRAQVRYLRDFDIDHTAFGGQFYADASCGANIARGPIGGWQWLFGAIRFAP